MARLIWGAATDPGRVRTGNEDNLSASPTMFAVADGMGGHQAGEVASLIVTQHLEREANSSDPIDLVRAIHEANQAIFDGANTNINQRGMGTTITALAVVTWPLGTSPEANQGSAGGTEMFVLANVGDSRTYLLRDDQLRQLSEDHSYVQALVNEGHITPEEARAHPRRNIVTRALGIEDVVEVDSWSLPIVRGDRYLLCSDGLVDEVEDAVISEILIRYTDPQTAADELVATANANGGRDNVTVVIVDVVEGEERADSTGEIDMTAIAANIGENLGADMPGTITAEMPVIVTDPAPDDTQDLSSDYIEKPAPDADSGAATTIRRSGSTPRLTLGRFLAAVGVGAVIVVSLAVFAAYARSGYYVAFNDTEHVTIYKGHSGGVLWFDPTVESPTALSRNILDEASIALVEDRRRFSGLKSAQEFVGERLTTTTTTTIATTTTTTTTTTTIAADPENAEEEQPSRTGGP